MIVGIDYSTRAIDMVKLSFDDDRAEWKRVTLEGARADERILHDARRKLRELGGEWWDDVALVAIERPAGRGTSAVIDMAVVAGVIVSRVPARIPIWRLGPSEWRRHCGLKGSASKDDVFAWAMRHWPYKTGDLLCTPQDAADAYCIAYAARAINASAASVAEGNQTQED